jgi:hypothetical protein
MIGLISGDTSSGTDYADLGALERDGKNQHVEEASEKTMKNI